MQMKTIENYIDAVRQKLKLSSYYETMSHLGMHRQAWTQIQKGAGVSEKNAIRISQILNIDPIEIMAISLALKAKNAESRNLWLKLAKEKENQRLSEEYEENREW